MAEYYSAELYQKIRRGNNCRDLNGKASGTRKKAKRNRRTNSDRKKQNGNHGNRIANPKFYNDALSKNSKMMIDLLIKVIILYDDKIEIFFKIPLTRGSDDDRGFSFAIKKIGITYDVPQRKTPVSLRFDISLRI